MPNRVIGDAVDAERCGYGTRDLASTENAERGFLVIWDG
jgi:hypothetical protein